MSVEKPQNFLRSGFPAFTMISNDAIVALENGEMTSDEFLIFTILCYRAKKETGVCFPSYESLMRSTKMCRAYVASSLKGLGQKGWIHKEKFSGSRNIYTVTCPLWSNRAVQGVNATRSRLERQPVQGVNANNKKVNNTHEQLPSNSQRGNDTGTLDKPAEKAEDPKAEPKKPQKLNPLQERIIRAAQSVGRVSAATRVLSPNRDRSEATAWKRLRPLVTEEDVALIEKFYAAPKSEDMDETWHRKQSATALMNQWTSQVEFSQLWIEKQKPTSTTEEFPSWDYEHFCKLVPEFEGIPAKDYPEHWRKGLQYVLEEAQDLYRERIKWTA